MFAKDRFVLLFLESRQLTASFVLFLYFILSEMLADKLAKASDLFVIPADTRDEKESAWLSLSGLSWLKSGILFREKGTGLILIKDLHTH